MPAVFTPEVATALDGPAWLAERRAAAAARLEGMAWPTPAEEIWRYSRIDELDVERYRPFGAAELGAPGRQDAPGGGVLAAEAGTRAGLVVVRDGRVVHTELDPTLAPPGVRVCDVATCTEGDAERWFGTLADASPDAFTVLHDACCPGGAFIEVPAGVAVPEPIVVLQWCDGDRRASFPHTLVVLGEGAQATVVERFASPKVDHLADAVVECVVGDGANLRYLSVQEHGPLTWSIALQRTHLGRDARFASSAVALGGAYARLRTETLLAGSGAESDLLAVYFGDGDQMLDFRTLQDHAAPRTRSDLLFKGAVEDRAASVYSGLVRLRREAQRSEAAQTNRNLVLTEGAHAESIPNLEIEANDVRCSHASAVGPVDEDQAYYLQSRGIPPAEAERLVVLGFFEDVLARLPVPAMVAPLRRVIHEKVGHLHPPGAGARAVGSGGAAGG